MESKVMNGSLNKELNAYLVRGEVVLTRDPLNIGRVKVRVFNWHSTHTLGIPDEALPWALPCFPYASYDAGSFIIPEEGNTVWVLCEGGDPEKLVYLGGMYGVGKSNDTFVGMTGYQQRTQPAGAPEIPTDIIDKRNVRVLYKSPKGSKIVIDEDHRGEYISFSDVFGQVIKLVSQQGFNMAHAFKYKAKDTVDKIGFPDLEEKPFNELVYKAKILLQGISGSLFSIISHYKGSIIDLASRGGKFFTEMQLRSDEKYTFFHSMLKGKSEEEGELLFNYNADVKIEETVIKSENSRRYFKHSDEIINKRESFSTSSKTEGTEGDIYSKLLETKVSDEEASMNYEQKGEIYSSNLFLKTAEKFAKSDLELKGDIYRSHVSLGSEELRARYGMELQGEVLRAIYLQMTDEVKTQSTVNLLGDLYNAVYEDYVSLTDTSSTKVLVGNMGLSESSHTVDDSQSTARVHTAKASANAEVSLNTTPTKAVSLIKSSNLSEVSIISLDSGKGVSITFTQEGITRKVLLDGVGITLDNGENSKVIMEGHNITLNNGESRVVLEEDFVTITTGTFTVNADSISLNKG